MRIHNDIDNVSWWTVLMTWMYTNHDLFLAIEL